jgi:alkylresorcinol/alkylpyrone synthase
MGAPRIVAVATSTPSHRFDQATLLRLAGYDDTLRSGFFRHSEIDGRHLFLDPATFTPTESVDELSARFRRGAIELGAQAVRRALAALGLKPSIQRVHVGDTGCASAMVALQQAANHVQAFPDHRAVVVAVEICSAAYFLDDRLESAVAHAIFADGAGALAVSGHGEGATIVAQQTLFRPEHLPAMGFEFPGGRPRVVLSKEVRRIGAGMMKEMAEGLMASQGLKKEDVRHFVLHSAGRRVIEQARRLLELDEAQIAYSRHVLQHFGNMSSATVLFVLEETLRSGRPAPGDWGLMIALGPGFAAEGALLRW